MSDQVNHPAHYNQGAIEVLDFIEDQKLDFNLGNAIKYICRAASKDGIAALRKAEWYVHRAAQRLQWPELTSKAAQAREAADQAIPTLTKDEATALWEAASVGRRSLDGMRQGTVWHDHVRTALVKLGLAINPEGGRDGNASP